MKKIDISKEFKKNYPNGVLVDSVDLLFDGVAPIKKTKRKKINPAGIKTLVFAVVAVLSFVVMTVVQFI